jgi:hypothetical protein
MPFFKATVPSFFVGLYRNFSWTLLPFSVDFLEEGHDGDHGNHPGAQHLSRQLMVAFRDE